MCHYKSRPTILVSWRRSNLETCSYWGRRRYGALAKSVLLHFRNMTYICLPICQSLSSAEYNCRRNSRRRQSHAVTTQMITRHSRRDDFVWWVPLLVDDDDAIAFGFEPCIPERLAGDLGDRLPRLFSSGWIGTMSLTGPFFELSSVYRSSAVTAISADLYIWKIMLPL